MKQLLLSLLSLCAVTAHGQIHVSTSGDDSNSGTASSPFLTIHKAVDVAQPGDTIWVHGGTYTISERIKIPQKKTSELKRCYLWAMPGEEVIIDGSAMHHTTESDFKMGRCIYVNHLANYWHFKGLTLCNAEDNGMKVEGSYNIIENCTFHDNNDTGLQIGMYKDFAIEETKELPAGEPKFNPGYQFCRGNKVINCDSYNNYDARTYNGTDDGGDADGFACKLFPGPGTEFYGCRAWDNSDDNWDLYMVYHPVVIDHCWAYHAGYNWRTGEAVGNGNGFKLGGGGSAGGSAFDQSTGAHVVRNCVSFGNYKKGFDQNNAYEGMYVINCTAWDNDFNYRFPTLFNYGGMYIRNCIGWGARTFNHEFLSEDKPGSVVPNTDFNSWTTLDNCNAYKEGQKNADGVKQKTSDYSDEFLSLSVDDFKAPRQTDGSLPDNGFARLKADSKFKDIGEPIVNFIPSRFMTEEEAASAGLTLEEADIFTIPYNDEAPEFGAYELDGMPATEDVPVVEKASLSCLTMNSSQEIVKGESIEEIQFRMGGSAKNFVVENLPEGLSYSLDGDVLTINGSLSSVGTFSYSVSVEGGPKVVKVSGTMTVLPPSRILTGDWYHFQDEADMLPADLKSVITVIEGSDASHPSSIKPAYTESGSVPAGCTEGALVMGRSNGGIQFNLPEGVMSILLNLHFTGGRAFRINWTLADGTTGSFTTTKYSKGTYTKWNLLAEAGIEQQALDLRTVSIVNTNSSGEVRLYDVLVRVPVTESTGISGISDADNAPEACFNLAGQRVSKTNFRGLKITKGKVMIEK